MDFIVNDLVKLALAEDIGPGDITTDYLIDESSVGEGYIVAKESLVIAGLELAKKVFLTLDPSIEFTSDYYDGNSVGEGTTIVTIKGNLRALLKGERTALNFLQRLSGISTNVRGYVEEMGESKTRLVDTRKTVPGWRSLEKYAVRVGGAFNHRMALYDGVLIKDNHIAACGSIKKAVNSIRNYVSHLVKIEVEVSNFEELQEALDVGADVIMLDNMSVEHVEEAVAIVDGNALVEVSGSVTIDQLKVLAATGVDIISSGALTHQSRAVDLSMLIERVD
jgi:nicotinate-nucleotide pyrophosphorylase (carboxylating)